MLGTVRAHFDNDSVEKLDPFILEQSKFDHTLVFGAADEARFIRVDFAGLEHR